MHRIIFWCSNALIVLGIVYIVAGFAPIILAETSYYFYHQKNSVPDEVPLEEIKETYQPANPEFSIIIPKINVNAPIIQNVSVVNETEYQQVLQNGVAHALGTQTPEQKPGNTYLFAHSTTNIFDVQKYAATFTLLNKLETGDRVILFYNNEPFTYEVISNEVVKSFNLEPLHKEPNNQIVTLQTCDPPGVPINRRIVTAKLIEDNLVDVEALEPLQ